MKAKNTYKVYRYEDAEGYGPYYNRSKEYYKNNNHRYGCSSVEKLESWWGHNNKGEFDLSKYNLVEYTVTLTDKAVTKMNKTGMVDFYTEDVISKRVIEDE